MERKDTLMLAQSCKRMRDIVYKPHPTSEHSELHLSSSIQSIQQQKSMLFALESCPHRFVELNLSCDSDAFNSIISQFRGRQPSVQRLCIDIQSGIISTDWYPSFSCLQHLEIESGTQMAQFFLNQLPLLQDAILENEMSIIISSAHNLQYLVSRGSVFSTLR